MQPVVGPSFGEGKGQLRMGLHGSRCMPENVDRVLEVGLRGKWTAQQVMHRVHGRNTQHRQIEKEWWKLNEEANGWEKEVVLG